MDQCDSVYIGFVHRPCRFLFMSFFFFNDTATTEIYTLSLHDALPIFHQPVPIDRRLARSAHGVPTGGRSEEHTSELQSRLDLVCRLLLEKKNKYYVDHAQTNYKYKLFFVKLH